MKQLTPAAQSHFKVWLRDANALANAPARRERTGKRAQVIRPLPQAFLG
jgi:hypothetical protein